MKITKPKRSFLCASGIICLVVFASLAPVAYGAHGDHDGPYGEDDGIHGGLKFSDLPVDPRIKGWITGVEGYWRPEGISHGTTDRLFGQPGSVYNTFSLGDGGWITVTFDQSIANGPGPDFMVCENGFVSRTPGFGPGLLFAELMFVEVSSDGIHFARFPSVCLNPNTVGGFGCIDPTYYHNVAGKHPCGNDNRDEGTPFDLDDLKAQPLVIDGTVDLNDIVYVKLIDVVGDGSTFDAIENPMHDPYPTPFGTGGADLNAVGVLNQPCVNLSSPDKPTLSAPGNDEQNVPLCPTLQTGPFSDEDVPAGDIHSGTRWQISKGSVFSDSESALDIESGIFLTSLTVPIPILERCTIYYWRVKFYDSSAKESDWSDIFSFTTTEISSDGSSGGGMPNNGIPNDQDLTYGSTVDLDGNIIADVLQVSDKFKVLNTVVGDGQIGARVLDDVTIEHFESIDPADIPDQSCSPKPDNILLGLIGFRLNVRELGDTATITVYLSRSVPSGSKWYECDSVRRWYPFPGATFSPDGRSLTLQLEDGGVADADGAKNGLIVAQGGIRYFSLPPDNEAEFKGVGGCFIATGLNGVVRISLAPIVAISYVTLHTMPMWIRILFLLPFGLFLIAWLRLRISRRKIEVEYEHIRKRG